MPFDCPPGHYCPQGTRYATEFACPIGTFNNASRLTAASECEPCTSGKYCAFSGLIEPTADCDEGFYCLRGSNVSSPAYGFEQGYVCSISGWGDGDCPGDDGNSTAPGSGDICPPGHYCPQGADHPVQCPPGHFNPTYGRSNISACQPCTPGFYCPNAGTVQPTLACPANFYCPKGQINPTLQCIAGHFCAGGDGEPKPCAPGTFQASAGQPTCDTCPAGFYCGNATVVPTACPQGSYCPSGSTYGTEFLCPRGTFGAGPGLQAITNCTECSAGKYCFPAGLTAPAGDCDPGHYCVGGSATRVPTSSFNGRDSGSAGIFAGDVCPPGHYCPAGSAAPAECPAGSFTQAFSNPAESYCQDCTPGYFCPSNGTVVPTQLCLPRYYCPAGSNASDILCTAGHYCPGGDATPIPCAMGTYANTTGLISCDTCPEGFVCGEATVLPDDCPAGYYCPAGTRFPTQYPCPEGTFSNTTNLVSASQCTPCSAGFYCENRGLIQPSGKCGPGHYCAGGSNTPTPTDGITGDQCAAGYICTYGSVDPRPNGVYEFNRLVEPGYPCPPGSYCLAGDTYPRGCEPGTRNPNSGASSCFTCAAGLLCAGNDTTGVSCPNGFYCPAGTSQPEPCPAGTYGAAATGLVAASQCAACPPGKYCIDGFATGDCAAGFVCRTRAPTPTPAQALFPDAYPCPQGFFCPEGTALEQPCSNGTFSAVVGATSEASCGPCPPGFTCADGNPTPIPCKTGHYCPGLGVEIPCPRRTWNPVASTTNITACRPCPAGAFCDTTGIADVSSFQCPAGNFCPEQTDEPLACFAGTYRPTVGAARSEDCLECPAGFLCETGFVVPRACRAGTTCPAGSTNETACPAGFYCPSPTATNVTEPLPCPAGMFCAEGSAAPSLCPEGTCCPQQSSYPLVCPKGTFSPADTSNTSRADCNIACQSCPPGTYSEAVDGTKCLTCTPGYVCSGRTSSATPFNTATHNGYPCPPGHYCPAGTAKEFACPRGSYNPLPGQSNLTACLPCPVDSYNNQLGQSACTPCSASSFAPSTGSYECTCRGAYRKFQWTDGMCICDPGYEGMTLSGELESQADGESDCQPKTFPWCDVGQQRLASGDCANIDCDSLSQCPTGAGIFLPSVGICSCRGAADASEVCGATCRATQIKMEMDTASGELLVTDQSTNPPTTKRLDPLDDIPAFTGSLSCTDARARWLTEQVASSGGFQLEMAASSGNNASSGTLSAAAQLAQDIQCDVYSVQMGDEGFLGVFGVDDSVTGATPGAGRRLRQRTRGLQQARAKLLQSQEAAVLESDSRLAAKARSEALQILRDVATLTASDLAAGAASFAGLGIASGQERWTARQLVAEAASQQNTWENNVTADWRVLTGAQRTWARLVTDQQEYVTQWVNAATATLQRAPGQDEASLGSPVASVLNWARAESEHDAAARRHLQTTVSDPFIARPVACLQLGQSFLWTLGVQADGSKSYPVYEKDSYLNSNPSFDYGPFRQLAQQLDNPALAAGISLFGYTFAQPGVFVFSSSTDKTSQMIVKVLEVGQQCPDSMQGLVFQPTTSSQLASLGIAPAKEIHLEPNWDLLASLLVGLFVIMVAVVGGVFVFRRRAWGDVALQVNSGAAGESKRTGTAKALKEYQKLLDDSRISRKDRDGVINSDSEDDAEALNTSLSSPRRLVGGAAVGSSDEQHLGARADGLEWPERDFDSDDEALDVEDEDLRNLIRQLQEHHEEVVLSFREQQDNAQRILDALHEESDELRRLIAARSAEMAADSAITGEGGEAAKQAAVLRQMEGELHGRSIASKQMERAEADIQAAIEALARQLQGAPKRVAKAMVGDLLAADPAIQDEAAAGEAIRALRPEVSTTGEGVRSAVQTLRDCINRYSDIVLSERQRRQEGLPVWKQVAGTDLKEKHPKVLKSLENFDGALGPLDTAVSTYLQTLRSFASGSTDYLNHQRKSLSDFLGDFSAACDTRNPAVKSRVQETHTEQLGSLVTQLHNAVEVLRGRLPSLASRVRSSRESLERSTKSALAPIASARQSEEDAAKAAGMTPVGLAGLSSQLQNLIETLQNSMYVPGMEQEGAQEGAEGAYEGGDDAAYYEDTGMDEAAAELVAAADRETEEEARELNEAIAKRHAEEEAEFKAQQDEARRQLMERLNDPDLTDEERQRLLADFERDQAALLAKMESERRRQDQDMKERLEERRQERLRRKLKRAEGQAADELERRQAEEAARLAEQQEAARAAAELEEEDDIAAQLASARAAGGDDTFDVESAMRKLKDEFESHQDTLASSLHSEKARQRAHLQQKLRERRQQRQQAAKARRQAAIAAAGTDYSARSAALKEEVEAVNAEGEAAKAQVQVDRDAQVQELKEEMQRARGKWLLQKEEYEAQLAEMLAQVDDEEAARKAAADTRIQGKWKLAADELREKQQDEIGAASEANLPSILARHAAENAKLGAERDAELAASDAEIEAAAAAARAQLAAEESKLRLATIRREAEWQQALQQGIHELRRAAAEEELTAVVESNRGSKEAGLLAKQAGELAAAPSDEARAALAKKHAGEMEELQRALNKEEAALLNTAEQDAERDAADLEAELERLRKEYENNTAELEASVDAVRKKQSADVKAKLAQRRARRMQAMRRRQQEEAAAARNSEEAAALAAAHAAEQAAVEGTLDENDASAMAAVEATHKLTLAAFDADAELAKLHKAMEKETLEREDALHKDKRRQRAELQRKLRERKAKKMARLRQKQMEERTAAAAAAAAADADAAAHAALAALDQRHAEEIADAEEDADELATAEEAQLEAKLDVAQKQYELDFAKDQETVQEQFAVLRAQADDEAERALQRVHGEKNRQTAALESRLRARKRRKMRALQRQQAAERAEADMKAAQATSEQQAKVTKEVLKSSSKDDEFDSAVLAAVRAILGDQVTADQLAATGALKRGDGASNLAAAVANVLPQGAAEPVSQAQLDEAEAARVAAAAEAERAALAAAQEEERLAAEEAAREEERAAAAEMEAEKQRQLEAKRNELAARLAAMNVTNQEQFDAIRAQQDKEMAEVEARLDEQQRSQQSKLKKRLAERKARKARAMARKHAAEMASTAEKEAQQLKALEAQAQAGNEVAALQQMLAAGDSVLSRAKAGEAVEALLRQRHTRETNDMLAEQYAERSRVLRATLQEVLEDKAAAREEVASKLKDEGASDAELAAELARLEEDFAQVQADAEKAALDSMEVKHAKQQMASKQRQLGELAAMLKEVAPDDKERLAEAENALEEAKKLLEFQENMQREREERNARAEAERRELEEQLAKETAAELAAQEAEMEESLAAERRKAEARMEEERERLRLEAEALRARTMEAAGKMNDEEKARVLAEFETAQARKEERQERQREKQKARLAAQLAKRKERALRKAEAANRKRLAEQRAKQEEAEAKAAAEAEAKRKALESKKAAEASALGSAVARATGKAGSVSSSKAGTPAVAGPTVLSPASAAGATPAGAGSTPLSVGGPQLQALQGKLNNIEKLLATLKAAAESGGAAVGDASPSGDGTAALADAAGGKSSGFVDPASRSTPSEGTLVVVPHADLNSSEQARMKIGQRLLHSVGLDRPPAGIALSAAASLPHDEYSNNAYRGTYYFDETLRTLHIRRGRFLSTGDFMLVLAHAAAHVNVGSMSNDSTAAFQAEFHRLMRAFGQELYTPAPSSAAPAPRAAGSAAVPAPNMRGSSTVQAAQASGLDDEDDDALDAAASNEERTWQAGSLPDRLAGISSLSKHTELQKYLASLEGDVLAGDGEDSESEEQPATGSGATAAQ